MSFNTKEKSDAQIELLTAPCRAELDHRVLELLAEHIDLVGMPRFMYLSPTRRKNREMTERLRDIRPSWKPQCLVPGRLAEQMVLKLAEPGQRWVTPELKELLVLRILEQGRFRTLSFKDSPTPPGIARHVIHALDTLSRKGLSPLSVRSGLPEPAGRDLDAVRLKLDETLKAHRLLDPADLLRLASEALREGSIALPENADLLVLDGFVAPDTIEADFLVELVRSRAGTVVTLPAPVLDHVRNSGWDNLPPEFRLHQHGRAFFDGLGLITAEDIMGWTGRDAGPLHRCTDAYGRPGSFPAVTEYPDRVSEVKGLARTIKRMSLDRNLRPEDFHVLVPRIDPYYRLFIEIFPGYGVPFNITRGIPLFSVPVVGRIQALIDAALMRDHEGLFRFYSSNLVNVPHADSDEEYPDFLRTCCDSSKCLPNVPALQDEPAIPIEEQLSLDMVMLDRVCRSAGIRGGRDLETDWIAPFVRHYHRRISAARESQEPERADRLAAELGLILKQLWLLGREFAELDGLTASEGAQTTIAMLLGLLDRYNVYGNLVRSLVEVESAVHVGSQIMFEKNVKGYNRAMEVLVQIGKDLETMGEPGAGLETIGRLFTERCRRDMIQEAGELAGVSISQMREIRNLVRPVVLLAGLTDQDFPHMATNNFLLPAGPDSEAFTRSVDESRFILHHVMADCGEALLSWPTSDGNDPLERSLLVPAGRSPAEGALDRDGDRQPFCRHEILESVGRSWKEHAPIPWQEISSLLEQYPFRENQSPEEFHREVRRALNAAVLKSQPDRLGPYDGIIGDPSVLLAIGNMLDSPRFSYSISMLNVYLRCPMEFFFRRVLGIEPVKEVPEALEAAEVGSVVHEILARFYSDRTEPVTQAHKVEGVGRMYATALEVLDSHDFLSKDLVDAWATREKILRGLYPPELCREFTLRTGVEAGTDLPQLKRGYLRVLVDHEANLGPGLHPWKVEWDFGLGNAGHLVITGFGGKPIRIRGRIDRVDAAKDETGPGLLWVYDYKTGYAPAMKDVKGNQDLQLQLCLLAAREILGDSAETQAGACFLSLKPGDKDIRKALMVTTGVPPHFRRKGADTWELSDEELEGVKDTVRGIDYSIRSGHFPAAIDSGACLNCDFQTACFRDEHRVLMFKPGLGRNSEEQ